jgi:spore coat polysaccharide biosynthesis protein SpsF (cytidylyltransferase family)
MTSTRLPAKVLRVVQGKTILEWVVRASKAVPGIDVVCVATPTGPQHDPIVAEAVRLGAVVVRGPETDVLERFRLAAEQLDANLVMRVTTDCPLMDPTICGQVLSLLQDQDVDYACNNEPFTFAHGLDCEVFTRAVLERAARTTNDPYDREHVTPWIKRDPSVSRAYLHGPGGDMASWRLTIDTPQDLAFFEAVAAHLGPDIPAWPDVAAVLTANPQLHDINRVCRQR